MERFQDAFAALVTDAPLREAFLRDADAIDAFGVSDRGKAALVGIGRDALVRYAESLLDKREAEFGRAASVTGRMIPDLTARYRRWLAEHPAPHVDSALPPGVSEALRALPALAEGLDPEWADLLVYEVYRRASRVDGRARFLDAAYAVHLVWGDIVEDRAPDPQARPTQYRFDRAVRWR